MDGLHSREEIAGSRGAIGRAGAVNVEITEILRTLWRHRSLISLVTIAFAVAAWVFVSRIQPVYTSTATILIEAPNSATPEARQLSARVSNQLYAITSEVEVLQSRSIVSRVVDSLGLVNDPEFNPTLRPRKEPMWIAEQLSDLKGRISDWLKGDKAEPEGAIDPNSPDAIREGVINNVMARVRADSIPQSMVLTVAFSSTSPAKAARIANELADKYVTSQLEAKFDAIRSATSWLTDRLATLKDAVSRSEEAVADYRKQYGILQGSDQQQPMQQRLQELNSQLVVTQSKRAELQARVARVESLIKAGHGVDATDEMMDSPLIQRLREQEATTAREASDLASRYGERHPEMIKKRAEQAEIESKINIEIAKLLQGMRSELSVLQEQERTLQTQVKESEDSILQQNVSSIQLHELERNAQANRTLYETFLSRFKETGDQEEIQQPDARVISEAQPSRMPSSPHTRLMTAAAGLTGFVLISLLMLLVEQFNLTIRGRRDLEQLTGLPVLGQIPQVRATPGHRTGSYLTEKPTSSFAEAFRIAWFGLKHAMPPAPKVVLVTSALPEEGKSLTSLSIARTAANLAMKVILVDADLRRPSLAGAIGLTPAIGLAEVLRGEASLEGALNKDPDTGIDLLLNKAASSMDAISAGASNAMAQLVARLRDEYDLVIIDSPPILPVADTQLFGQLADRTVFCVRWNKTPRVSVQLGLQILRDAHVPVAGTLLTRVNLRKHARYGYGESAYYGGKYRSYYAK